jgi:arylsulfatase A-like enzyme
MPKRTTEKKRPNILLIAIDSLLADHMSCYGYKRLTTPHMDRFAAQGTLFEKTYSAHIPTTPAYSSLLTGRDCFGTEVVALRHQGGLTKKVKTLAEICRRAGYTSTCVGFKWNPASRGFDNYVEFEGWGSWPNRSPKAMNLDAITRPEIERLQATGKPWFMMLRHMDPHSPYLPPEPFDRMFYHGDELDPANPSMQPVMDFKPFRDYFVTWMPPGITDINYVNAQYDGAIAYMDACISRIFTQLQTMGILDDTIVVINADHGETLDDHQCWFDHHGLYDVTLHVPLIIRYPAKLPAGKRISGYNQHKDLVPTLLDLAEIKTSTPFDGRSLMQMVRGEVASFESEFYITECTWMRKHGWRTPEWKLIIALEPDFHFKPKIELYNLIQDPHEDRNVADEQPAVVKLLRARMEAWIAKREQETGIKNPMLTQGDWHGHKGVGAFKSSQQAYDTLHIGDVGAAQRLQAKNKYAARGEHTPGEENDDTTQLITVVGRGHGGTRAMSHTLAQSGVYMGTQQNISGDLVPAQDFYDACSILSKHVVYKGDMKWDFSKLHTMPIDPEFEKLVKRYLKPVLESPAARKGWKLPETAIAFPWIVRMFPQAYYIQWMRDPRDSILSEHLTDDLAKFGIPYDPTDNLRLRRAISWQYQAQIIRDTPKPAKWLSVRFEDFVLDQDSMIKKLSDFLGFPLVKIAVDPAAVGRWKQDKEDHDFDFLQAEMKEYGYLDSSAKGKPPAKRKTKRKALAAVG